MESNDPVEPVDPVDPAKAALARARASARCAPSTPSTGSGSAANSTRPASKSSSAATQAATGRDPVLLAAAVDGMVTDRGWQLQTAVASLTGRWAEIVGPDVAEHVLVDSYEPETRALALRADSTAWAVQVKLLLPVLMSRLEEELGAGVVTAVEVKGPTAPSWVKGPRTAPGRGPRDTYG